MTHQTSSETGKAAETDDDEHLFADATARVGRLEAVVAATGGTLHDVNNLLTVLSGNLYLLTEAVRDKPDLLGKCREARNTATRAGTLIRELLSFTRGAEEPAPVICPGRHVELLLPLLRRAVDANHAVLVEVDEDPWHVTASAAQLESAVANLVINAKEAMQSPGTISIRVRNIALEKQLNSRISVAPGEYVCMIITDTGPGIPSDILPDITKPLFTSKSSGNGNGMGLAMVQSFANRSGGQLDIESSEGNGATFSIWLPRNSQSREVTANMTIPIAALPAGDEAILLVTSEPDSRTTTAQLLGALGYTVLQSPSRADALCLARNRGDLALVICDRAEKTQAEDIQWLADLRRTHPLIKQLALVEPGASELEVAKDADAAIRLPIEIPELARSLRKALGSG